MISIPSVAIRSRLAAAFELFGLLPAAIVLLLTALGFVALLVDQAAIPGALGLGRFLYTGGAEGARTLLGSVASSILSVTGTIFSITIAALTLASNTMGPRLLRNFTEDRFNQATLGVLLGTFAYDLVVLRTIRNGDGGAPGQAFVPSFSLSLGIVLAFVCLGLLIAFVAHVAGRINVETVIDLEHRAVHAALLRLTRTEAPDPLPPPGRWNGAVPVADDRDLYLRELDTEAIADWAAGAGARVRLLVRPGDPFHPGMSLFLLDGPVRIEEAREAIRRHAIFGSKRSDRQDIEYAVRHLVEVAVRALSPSINDPTTARTVLDRLGSLLALLAPRHLLDGRVARGGAVVVEVPVTTYDGLADLMFDAIRRNGVADPAIGLSMLDVLSRVAEVERRPERLAVLARHACLVRSDATEAAANATDRARIEASHARFERVRARGPLVHVRDDGDV